MIAIPYYVLVVTGLVIVWLIFKLFEYKSKIAKPERVYVDSSGVAVNPPKFIDVLQNKTINFDIGKFAIKVNQITIGNGLTIVRKIAKLYEALHIAMENIPDGKIAEMKNNLFKINAYNQIVYQIYLLSKPFVKSRRKYKKELFKMAKLDHQKVMLITEQIFDYWMYVGKLAALLARGATLRLTTGEKFTWNSYETDIAGNTIIKPRFALSTN
jgi:hypothetical protein